MAMTPAEKMGAKSIRRTPNNTQTPEEPKRKTKKNFSLEKSRKSLETNRPWGSLKRGRVRVNSKYKKVVRSKNTVISKKSLANLATKTPIIWVRRTDQNR